MTDTIYYLTGRGGHLNSGLGIALSGAGMKVHGRELSGSFAKLTFQSQVEVISKDLQEAFWDKDSKVVAVSYGAYLLLHALAELKPYEGSVLLLSPILGGVINKSSMRYFSPPRSDKLMSLVEKNEFPVPHNIEVHVGDSDWQSPYERVIKFSEVIGGDYSVVSDTGHQLGKNYVAPILKRWC